MNYVWSRMPWLMKIGLVLGVFVAITGFALYMRLELAGQPFDRVLLAVLAVLVLGMGWPVWFGNGGLVRFLPAVAIIAVLATIFVTSVMLDEGAVKVMMVNKNVTPTPTGVPTVTAMLRDPFQDGANGTPTPTVTPSRLATITIPMPIIGHSINSEIDLNKLERALRSDGIQREYVSRRIDVESLGNGNIFVKRFAKIDLRWIDAETGYNCTAADDVRVVDVRGKDGKRISYGEAPAEWFVVELRPRVAHMIGELLREQPKELYVWLARNRSTDDCSGIVPATVVRGLSLFTRKMDDVIDYRRIMNRNESGLSVQLRVTPNTSRNAGRWYPQDAYVWTCGEDKRVFGVRKGEDGGGARRLMRYLALIDSNQATGVVYLGDVADREPFDACGALTP